MNCFEMVENTFVLIILNQNLYQKGQYIQARQIIQFLNNSDDWQHSMFGITESLDFVHCLMFKIKLFEMCDTGQIPKIECMQNMDHV